MKGSSDPLTKFIILSPGRSGSEMLRDRLQSHPHIETQGEILRSGFRPEIRRTTRIANILGFRRAAKTRFDGTNLMAVAGDLLWDFPVWKTQAAGFKIIDNQLIALRSDQREALLATPNLRVIELRRDDMLGHFVSMKLGHEHGFKHRRANQPALDLPAIALTPEAFSQFVSKQKIIRQTLKLHVRHLPIFMTSYEQQVQNPEQENRGICEFLGVEPMPLVNRLVRNSDRPLSERIANYDEFATALKNTPLECFLERELFTCRHTLRQNRP